MPGKFRGRHFYSIFVFLVFSQISTWPMFLISMKIRKQTDSVPWCRLKTFGALVALWWYAKWSCEISFLRWLRTVCITFWDVDLFKVAMSPMNLLLKKKNFAKSYIFSYLPQYHSNEGFQHFSRFWNLRANAKKYRAKGGHGQNLTNLYFEFRER